MQSEQILFTNGTTSIVYARQDTTSDKLAITFPFYGSLDVNAPGFAEAFLAKRGWDILAVKCNRNNWFQDLSADDFAGVIAMLPAYQDVLTYGSSMGGYGALYFAANARATKVIALSPQLSIDPALVPWEQRWEQEGKRIKFTHAPLGQELSRCDPDITLFYDPQTGDRLHIQEILSIVPEARPIPALYSGHPSGAALGEAGLLKSAIESAIEGKCDLDRRAFRSRRRLSATYYYALAQACLQRNRTTTALSLLRSAVSLDRRPDILLVYSRLLFDHGEVEQALETHREAVVQMPPEAHRMARLGFLEEMNSNLEAASRYYAEAIRLDSGVVDFYAADRRVLVALLEGSREARAPQMSDRAALAALDEIRRQQSGTATMGKGIIALALLIPFAIVFAYWGIARALGLI